MCSPTEASAGNWRPLHTLPISEEFRDRRRRRENPPDRSSESILQTYHSIVGNSILGRLNANTCLSLWLNVLTSISMCGAGEVKKETQRAFKCAAIASDWLDIVREF